MEYRNPEHYPDPTAGQAIENIEREEERIRRQRRWGGRKHRRDGAHRMDGAGWKPRPGLRYQLVWKADDRVKGLETRLENLRMMATDTANHMAEGSVNGGSDKDRTGRIMAEIDEMEHRIMEAKEEARKIREEVWTGISRIGDPIVQKAIYLHDIKGHTCEDTADIMHCSRTQVYRWRDSGYAELENILGKKP